VLTVAILVQHQAVTGIVAEAVQDLIDCTAVAVQVIIAVPAFIHILPTVADTA
jgi:hypothetical protein